MYNSPVMNICERVRNIGLGVALAGAAAIGGCGVISIAVSEIRTRTYDVEERVTEYIQVDLNELIADPAKFKDKYIVTTGYYERNMPIEDSRPVKGTDSNMQQIVFLNNLYLNEDKTGEILPVRETVIIDNNKAAYPFVIGTTRQEVKGKILEVKDEEDEASYILQSVSQAPGVSIIPTP